MRLRPGPLVETAAVFAFGFVLAFISFAMIWQDVQIGFNFAFQTTMLLFMPLFSLSAVLGFFMRDGDSTRKFLLNGAAIGVVAIGGWALLTFPEPVTTTESITINVTVAVFAVCSLIGAALTEFWLIDNDGPQLRFRRGRERNRPGRPEVLNTTSSSSKKKKK